MINIIVLFVFAVNSKQVILKGICPLLDPMPCSYSAFYFHAVAKALLFSVVGAQACFCTIFAGINKPH